MGGRGTRHGTPTPPPPLLLQLRLLVLLLLLLLPPSLSSAQNDEWYTAFVNVTVVDPLASNRSVSALGAPAETGRYGGHSPKEDAQGLLRAPLRGVNACGAGSRFFGPGETPPPRWVALVARGNCTFREKIVRARNQSASAVLVYNLPDTDGEVVTMNHQGTGDIVAVMIPYWQGQKMRMLMRNATLWAFITKGTRNVQYTRGPSVVFVSVSFILLMIVSLAWLIFYYVQKFRYASARNRNQRRLEDAAKKAIGQIPSKTIKRGDRETETDFDNCAVCIEEYKPSEVVRILPCKHMFHKTCVDPWLVDHRTCPMCKLNILKALGILVNEEECGGEEELGVGAGGPTGSHGRVADGILGTADPNAHTNQAFVSESSSAQSSPPYEQPQSPVSPPPSSQQQQQQQPPPPSSPPCSEPPSPLPPVEYPEPYAPAGAAEVERVCVGSPDSSPCRVEIRSVLPELNEPPQSDNKL
uniref:RING finger protein 150-like n=1 Tax=Petromyzon marinus TaxID=7757 RepID=A0AAJ7WWC4_PETMA|nr:RING finger protein 150-like [Petromyzon marinus]